MKMRRNTRLWTGLAIAFVIYFCIFNYYAEKEKISRTAKIETERSISVLPDGVEEVWTHYIRKRLSEEIKREGRNLKVRTTYIGIAPTTSYVSINHPYKIDCNSFDTGISVTFGDDEETGISANITGYFSPDHENEPDRRVPFHSIASKNLDKNLCKMVANWLSIITTN